MIANAAATHTQRWAGAMAESGHDVRLFSVRDHTIEGVKVVPYLTTRSVQPSRSALASGYIRLRYGLSAALRDFSPDVVHAHYASTNGYIAALTTSVPTILTVWGTDVIPKPGRSLSKWQQLRTHKAISNASLVTSASEFMATHVHTIMPDKNVEIVPFGVDLGVFTSEPIPDTNDLLVAKSLEARYGINFVIEAMGKVTGIVPDATLTIAGDGTQRRQLVELAARTRADIRFVGNVDHRELPTYMAAAAAIVNPTIVDESFGVVVLEAQAVGRPVISTRVGAIPDVCIEGETALLVPPQDSTAMADAIIDVLRGRRVQNASLIGPRFVRDSFTWQASVAKMNVLYAKAADA